jgi:hypothetical protein
MTKRPQQIKTIDVMIQEVMRSKAFRRGVADVRAGRKPRFDEQTEGDDLQKCQSCCFFLRDIR